MEYIGNTRVYIDKFNYLKYNNKYNLKYPFIRNIKTVYVIKFKNLYKN